jgi:predicted transport protein
VKIIELDPNPPSMTALLKAVQDDDVLLVRSGHPLVRLEKFDDDDWEDWKYEHGPEAIARGEESRRQYRNGKFRVLSPNGKTDRLSKASDTVRSLFQRYKTAISKFEALGGTVTCRPTGRGFSFFVNGHRLATFTIEESNLKIWLKVKPGALKDPAGRAHRTKIANTVQDIRDEHDFDYIIGLIKQAYLKNR